MSQTRDLQGRKGGIGRSLKCEQGANSVGQGLGGQLAGLGRQNCDSPGLVWG